MRSRFILVLRDLWVALRQGLPALADDMAAAMTAGVLHPFASRPPVNSGFPADFAALKRDGEALKRDGARLFGARQVVEE